eukprot:12591563-Alexandrium_andersonii.AAC.1
MPPSVKRPPLRASGRAAADLVGRLHCVLGECIHARPLATVALVALALCIGRTELRPRRNLLQAATSWARDALGRPPE